MERKLSKNAKKVWRTRCAMICLLFAFISGCIYIFSPLIAFIVAGVDLLTFLIIYLIAVPLVYHVTTLVVRKDGITITKGILMRKRMNIMAKKIQYVELIQTPVQRLFKVYTVAFHTAGATAYVSQVDADLGRLFRSYKE